MASSPILITGGAGVNDPGESVVGSASNRHQTDTYLVAGFNNTITENGGNLVVNSVSENGEFPLFAPDTTIVLGNAIGVTDTIDLGYGPETIMQEPGTSLTKSVVDITLSGAVPNIVSLVNNGGTNDLDLLGDYDGMVTLTGAVNIVNGALFSIIRLNGNATNLVDSIAADVIIGSPDDDLFGYGSTISFGAPGGVKGGDEGPNAVTAGDENVVIYGTSEPGLDSITLGDGKNTVALSGVTNRITVGGGDNEITAGSGYDIVAIRGLDGNDTATPTDADGTDDRRVPRNPIDTVVLAGSNNTVTATYENVVISGGQATGDAVVTLGDGANNVMLGGDGNTITVGSGRNAITLSGSGNQIIVTDATGRGHEAIDLTTGTNDFVTLGAAGATVTDTGTGTTTISQTASSTQAVQVNLNSGTGIVTLGDGHDRVAVGANSNVVVGNGNDTLSVGDGSTLLAGAGHDKITLGDHARLGVFGSSQSSTHIQLGNDDVVGVTGGRVITNDSVGNDLVYLDGVSDGSTVNFANLDDSVIFGSNASARVFLYSGGGDLVEVQAPDASGSYTGTIDVSGFTNDIFYLGSLYGGKVAEALNNYAAVLDNITQSGGQQILSLQGGGKVVFEGHVQLHQDEFAFTTYFGTVVPTGL